ncbi:hypothetical protein B0J18DRAFT_409543 [Chaetomium sp. MPI-SDFR-AT-0129]|nr:hypothetical protein B0J18DRAFT_409543 [Chaetomium sp. MPI-SDFR-AT-0129]
MGDNDRTGELQTNSLYRALSGLLNSDKFSDMAIHCGGRNDEWVLTTAPGVSFLESDDENDTEREPGKDKDENKDKENGKDNEKTLVGDTGRLSPAGPAGTPALADQKHNDADNVQDETGPPTSDAQSDTGSNFSDNSNFHRSASDESNHPAEEYAEFAPQEDHVQVLDGTGAEAELPLNRREKELNTGEENALEGNLRFLQEIRIQQGFFLSMRLYFMADKFDVPALKLLARDRFYRAAEFSWFDHPCFPAVVDELYTGTPPSDLALREIVCRLVGCNIHSQAQRSRLDEVMRKHGDFAVGVLNYFINWHHK